MDQEPFDETGNDPDRAGIPPPDAPMSIDDDECHAHGTSLDEDLRASHLLPDPPERTLKEKLVERERQKRIETERARLKRQFALSNNGAVMEESQSLEGAAKEDGSVVGTVGGGSSVAAAALDINDEKQSERLGYAMERFLKESGQAVTVSNGGDKKPKAQNESGGVVMERFLSEPFVVPPVVPDEHDVVDEPSPDVRQLDIPEQLPQTTVTPPTASVTFDDSDVVHTHPDDSQPVPRNGSEVGAGSVSISTVEDNLLTANDSMDVGSHSAIGMATLADLDQFTEHRIGLSSREPDIRHEASSSVSSLQSTDQPIQPTRVIRLTEREIQEMEAIEEASIGNAPPSEREDTFSEVEDMLGTFPDPTRDLGPHEGFSVQTRTTASVSNTSVGGNQSGGGQSQEEATDDHSIDRILTASVSSHLALSPGSSDEGGVSVTVNPPSVIANEDHADEMISPNPDVPDHSIPPVISDSVLPSMPIFDHDEGPLDAEASARANAGVVNRRLRPGVSMTPPRGLPKRDTDDAGELKRVLSMPEKMHVTVDGFDYDKYDFIPTTPHSIADNSFQDLPGDGSWPQEEAMMHVSPLQTRKPAPSAFAGMSDSEEAPPAPDLNPAFKMNYGAFGARALQVRVENNMGSEFDYSDRVPLVPQNVAHMKATPRASVRSIADSMFSSIRSDSITGIQEEANDASRYKTSSILARAFPERFLTLFVTLLVEIPVLLMISGGSDRLCFLVGRHRYQLLMGFLPLSTAISGNCGLQASTLTTRAISQHQVTVENFRAWFHIEVGAATLLGLVMGTILGTCAFVMSDFDISFAMTIFIAQFISGVTAGFTGALAPLIVKSFFRRDSGKWEGPLATAIQDIVGTFTMVVLSYYILVAFGPHDIAPSDMCGAASV